MILSHVCRCVGAVGTLVHALCSGAPPALSFTGLEKEQKHRHLGPGEAPGGCLQISKVFLVPCFIFEIDVSSQFCSLIGVILYIFSFFPFLFFFYLLSFFPKVT